SSALPDFFKFASPVGNTEGDSRLASHPRDPTIKINPLERRRTMKPGSRPQPSSLICQVGLRIVIGGACTLLAVHGCNRHRLPAPKAATSRSVSAPSGRTRPQRRRARERVSESGKSCWGSHVQLSSERTSDLNPDKESSATLCRLQIFD